MQGNILAILVLALGLFAPAGISPALADDAAEIRYRLEQWVGDFNAARGNALCDLYSRDLVAVFRGQPTRGHDEVCDLLMRAIADPARDYRYDLDLHEVIVEGDLAVARLTLTLFISPLNITSVEPGMNVFRKEPDGAWRIIRYFAYEEEP